MHSPIRMFYDIYTVTCLSDRRRGIGLPIGFIAPYNGTLKYNTAECLRTLSQPPSDTNQITRVPATTLWLQTITVVTNYHYSEGYSKLSG
jgi:hypothetical protein